MDSVKTGKLIYRLRHEKNLTQKQLADMLGISDRTVSKWERGLGAPDISLLNELANCLNINTQSLLNGEYEVNDVSEGNMRKSKYYVCPNCKNLVVSTGDAEIYCCGRKLEDKKAQKADSEHEIITEDIENELYLTTKHPMTKEHYISFVAFVSADRMNIVKLYPEWDMQVRLPRRGHGMFLWYCTEHGLFYKYI